MEASENKALVINTILQRYESSSGQVINRDKSSVMVSTNATPAVKNSVLNALGLETDPRCLIFGSSFICWQEQIGSF